MAGAAFADTINGDADSDAVDSPHGNSIAANQQAGTTVEYDLSALIAQQGPNTSRVFVADGDTVTVTITRSGAWLASSAGSPATWLFSAYDISQSGKIAISVPCSALNGAQQTMTATLTGNASNARAITGESLSYIITATTPAAASCTPSDTTPPVITPNITGTLGNNGWYTSNVTVTFAVSDAQSPVTSKSAACDASNQVTSDTDGVTFTCTATSAGGTSSQSVTIKRDATPPTLNPTVSPNPVIRNSSATASAGANDATLPGSGLFSSSCDAVDTSVLGPQSVMCYAADNAGNTNSASASYTVALQITGFSAPVDMNIRNAAKAGQAIPLKFYVSDANGAVTDLASVAISTAPLSCNRTDPPDDIEFYASGSSGLQNLGGGFYQFNWKTPASLANSCKTMTLTAGFGTLSAQFEFKK